jgi:TM2 domain-containing membrane protein YozV
MICDQGHYYNLKMIPSGDKNTSELVSSAAQPISVHRAFVYSASAPGLGEFYAGSRMRGLVTAALFIFFTVWFARMLFVILSEIVSQIFGSLNGLVVSRFRTSLHRLPAVWVSAICRLSVGTIGYGAGLHPAVPQWCRSTSSCSTAFPIWQGAGG